MKKPLVSVIIPVHNRPDLLKEAVLSVASQGFRDFELIVVDDCSDANPEPFLRAIAEKAGIAIKILRLETRSGMPGYVRNRGVGAAEADLIAFLDSDDLWLPEKLEKQYYLMRGAAGSTGEISISHTREKWLRNGREISQASQKHRREGDIFADALWKCIIGPSTVMMEKKLFERYGGFREDIEVAEDYELWLKVTAENRVSYLDEPLTVKRAGGWEQLSEKYGQIEIFRIEALKGLLGAGFFREMPERKAAAEAVFREKCLIYASGCRKRGRTGEAESYEALAGGV